MLLFRPLVTIIERISFAGAYAGLTRHNLMEYISGAVDKVRRQEHKKLRKEGRDDLKGTKYHWLTNKQNLSPTKKKELVLLRKSMGDQGDVQRAVELCQSHLGKKRLGPVAVLGHALPVGTYETSRQNRQRTSLGDH